LSSFLLMSISIAITGLILYKPITIIRNIVVIFPTAKFFGPMNFFHSSIKFLVVVPTAKILCIYIVSYRNNTLYCCSSSCGRNYRKNSLDA